MPSRVLEGVAAAPGVAIGIVRLLDAPEAAPSAPPDPWPVEAERARAALTATAVELEASAARLRDAGRGADADMVEASALMAGDPELAASVEEAIRAGGMRAADAIRNAAASYAGILAALDDPYLAGRADDVRSVGRRAAALASGTAGADAAQRGRGVILVARDLGPADVAELDDGVAGIALAGGGPTTHAAIVARSLGVPMVVGAGEALLGVAPGARLAVDGDGGVAVIEPDAATAAVAAERMAARAAARERDAADAALATVTRDGHHVLVRVNAAAAAEVQTGLAAGADGVGLLRTELGFLEAAAWPTEAQHRAALEPVLELLPNQVATVRLLDFGGDKTPPFLAGSADRGIALLLRSPEALDAQLRGLVAACGAADVRVLLPLVETPDEVETVRAALAEATGGEASAVGAMVETPTAAAAAPALAAACEFLSIGTNDLTHATIGTDRFGGGAAETFHPRVLVLIRDVVDAAHAAGIPVEVCGEAASHPVAMPLLVGLGVDELSVGASRVAPIRRWVRALDRRDAARLVERALAMRTAEDVAELVRETMGDALAEEGTT